MKTKRQIAEYYANNDGDTRNENEITIEEIIMAMDEWHEQQVKNLIENEQIKKMGNKVKIGDKYIIPSGTQLWFISLQQSLITTKKYVIEVTHTGYNDTSFFGDLYVITFEGGALPGIIKLRYGETSCDLSRVEPLGDTLSPKIFDFKYNVKTEGYMRFHERKCCDNCKYYKTNSGEVAKQDVTFLCTKIEPNFEIMNEDVCDEHECDNNNK